MFNVLKNDTRSHVNSIMGDYPAWLHIHHLTKHKACVGLDLVPQSPQIPVQDFLTKNTPNSQSNPSLQSKQEKLPKMKAKQLL